MKIFRTIPTAQTLINRACSIPGYDGSQASDKERIDAFRYSMLIDYLCRYHSLGQDHNRGYWSWSTQQGIALQQCRERGRINLLVAELQKRALMEIADNDYDIQIEP